MSHRTRKKKSQPTFLNNPRVSHLPKQQITSSKCLILAEEPMWLTICLRECFFQERLAWMDIFLNNHSPFLTKDALQRKYDSTRSSSHRMTQISNCLESPNFPTITMSPYCQGQEGIVAEKSGHRVTKMINTFLCSTSSATKESPHALSDNIKGSNLGEEGHINSFAVQIILFGFLKIDAVSAILSIS